MVRGATVEFYTGVLRCYGVFLGVLQATVYHGPPRYSILYGGLLTRRAANEESVAAAEVGWTLWDPTVVNGGSDIKSFTKLPEGYIIMIV